MTTPSAEQQQAIADYVEASSESEMDDLLEALSSEFPPEVVDWWSAQWLDLLDDPSQRPMPVE